MDYSEGISSIGSMLLVYFLVLGFLGIFAIAAYVLSSLGVYTIAKRRGISKPWLAWLPIGSVWILGSISDQYQQQMKNKQTKRRKILLGLDIAGYSLSALYIVCIIVLAVVLIGSAASFDSYGDYYYGDYYYADYGTDSELALVGTVMAMYVVSFVFEIVLSALAIAECIFMYMSYYDLFVSCDPDKAVLFLVLSIVTGLALPVLLFIVRNKDDGMHLDEEDPVLISAAEEDTLNP